MTSVQSRDRFTRRPSNNARSRLLTIGAGLLATAALLFTARNFTLSRRTFELTEQGQVTDRYTKAIEQLGSDKVDVRIGGIYALERVARDSPRDHPTVMEVLAAFIREHSCERRSPLDANDGEEGQSVRPDVQAAITVVARRNIERDILIVDLADAHLDGADLTNADLSNANFTNASLRGADLTEATLRGAHFRDANLSSAYLGFADFTNADLSGAYLNGAILDGTMLAGARLVDADLTGADVSVLLLEDADFTRAKWPTTAPPPEGWERDAHAGHLLRTRTDPWRPAETN